MQTKILNRFISIYSLSLISNFPNKLTRRILQDLYAKRCDIINVITLNIFHVKQLTCQVYGRRTHTLYIHYFVPLSIGANKSIFRCDFPFKMKLLNDISFPSVHITQQQPKHVEQQKVL